MRAYLLLIVVCAILSNRNGVDGVKVILSMDDGWAEHLQVANDLTALGAKGVFYINSGRIGQNQRLTKEQLHQIADQGHEIAGHTKMHSKLTTQNYTQQKEAICADRDQLLEWGFNVTTFAFPYGADTTEALGILGLCGFNGARDSGGIRTNSSCTRCPKSDKIPPANPQQIRSVSYRSVMGLGGLKWYVTQADSDPKYHNGVIVFIFHEYGNFTHKVANIHPEEFKEFVGWLNNNSIPIVTTNSIIGTTRIYPNFDKLPNPSNVSLGKPYIALTFDYGTIDHLAVSQLLDQHEMHGTFFINSGHIGQTGYLSAAQLIQLQTNGHELGGRGQNQDEHLINLNYQEQHLRIQTDYNVLTGLGLNITSFAWPYGETSANLTAIVENIGYHRARDIGGIKVPTSCSLCPSTLKLPLTSSEKMALRSFNVKSYHSIGDLMWQVFRAEDWQLEHPTEKSMLVFTFGSVCNGCAFKFSKFENFIRWLKPRFKIGTVNEKINKF